MRVSTAAKSSFQTTNPKVFAGGDMVRGSDLVVTAVFDLADIDEQIAEEQQREGWQAILDNFARYVEAGR